MKKLVNIVDETPYLSSSPFPQCDQVDRVISKTLLDNNLLERGLYDRLNKWIERYYRERIHLIPPLT